MDASRIMEVPVPVRAVTRGKPHLFGYFDRQPWDASGRYLAALELDFQDRPPRAEDRAVIGLIDTQDGERWTPLGETFAWNWQMGSNLVWLGTAPDREVLYNVREDGRFASVVCDVFNGRMRKLPLPVAAVSADGKWALSINFARIARERPGYGYQGAPDPFEHELAPERDGVWLMDLASGDHKLVLSLAAAKAFRPQPTMEGVHHRLYDLRFNPSATRWEMIHRWRQAGQPAAGRHHTRMLTADRDGANLHVVNDHGGTSHNFWRDDEHLLAWADRNGRGQHYYLFKDRTDQEPPSVGGEVFDRDGHCSYSPDGQWILTDTYPDQERFRHLMLYRIADGLRVNIGKFYAPKEIDGEIRCDLHPRFSRDGKQVCIDSVHEGTRQVYVLDVSRVVSGEALSEPS